MLEDEQAQRLLDALSITTNDEQVAIHWTVSTDDLVEVMKRHKKRFKEIKGTRDHWHRQRLRLQDRLNDDGDDDADDEEDDEEDDD